MQIKEIMTSNVKVVEPTANLRTAASIMDEIDAGSLIVCDGERLLGLVTDRDIVIRSISAGYDPNTALVRDAMTSPIDYCFENQSIEEVASIMKDKQVRRLPVIDQNKKLVGIVSLGDLATAAQDQKLTAEVTKSVSETYHESSDQQRRLYSVLFDVRNKLKISSSAFGYVASSFAGAILGAGLMYLMDPQRGKHRRALIRDQAVHLSNEANHLVTRKARHYKNKAKGLIAGTRSDFKSWTAKVSSIALG